MIYDRVDNDFYREDRRCVEEFLKAEFFTGQIWDPCCGTGNIPQTALAAGYDAFGTDIIDRGYGSTTDFFATDMRVDNIVSNPPYAVMREFIDKALASTKDKVAVIGLLSFLESQGRKEWFKTMPLSTVWVSSRRLSMPPGDTDIKASGGTKAYAWFVFEHGHRGDPKLGWV